LYTVPFLNTPLTPDEADDDDDEDDVPPTAADVIAAVMFGWTGG